MKVYGLVRTCFDCVEQSVASASSLINYFEQKASAGTALAFTSDLSVRAVTSTNVYVTDVNFNAENVGTQNIRNFTLTLQETWSRLFLSARIGEAGFNDDYEKYSYALKSYIFLATNLIFGF